MFKIYRNIRARLNQLNRARYDDKQFMLSHLIITIEFLAEDGRRFPHDTSSGDDFYGCRHAARAESRCRYTWWLRYILETPPVFAQYA